MRTQPNMTFYIFTFEIRKNAIHGEDISSACNYIEAGNTSVLRAARVPPEPCVTTPLTVILCKVNGAPGPAGKIDQGIRICSFHFHAHDSKCNKHHPQDHHATIIAFGSHYTFFLIQLDQRLCFVAWLKMILN
jgi:hypothetical protein